MVAHVEELAAPQIVGVGLDIVGRRLLDRLLLLRQKLDLELLDDRLGDLVLDGEDVGEVAVVAVGPEMAAGRPFDQLGVDPHPVPGLADAALDHIGDAQLLGDLLQVRRPCPCR